MPRGTKTCPKCNEANGPRAFTCKKCGFEFPMKSKSTPPKKESNNLPTPPKYQAPKVSVGSDGRKADYVVLTPAGKVPIKFKTDFSDDEIQTWAKDIREYGMTMSIPRWFSKDALIYWAQTCYNRWRDEKTTKRLEELLED